MANNSFIMYLDFAEIFAALNDEEAGQLIKAIFKFLNGDEVKLNEKLNLCFIPIRQQLSRNLKKYEAKVEKLRQNGKLGGRPKEEKNQKKANGFSEKQMVFEENSKNQIESVNVNDNVNVNVNDNVNVNVNDNKSVIIPLINKREDILFDVKPKLKEICESILGKDIFIGQIECMAAMELSAAYPDFWERLPECLRKGKDIRFKSGYKPTLRFFLVEKNFTDVLNGAYDNYESAPKTDNILNIFDKLEREGK